MAVQGNNQDPNQNFHHTDVMGSIISAIHGSALDKLKAAADAFFSGNLLGYGGAQQGDAITGSGIKEGYVVRVTPSAYTESGSLMKIKNPDGSTGIIEFRTDGSRNVVMWDKDGKEILREDQTFAFDSKGNVVLHVSGYAAGADSYKRTEVVLSASDIGAFPHLQTAPGGESMISSIRQDGTVAAVHLNAAGQIIDRSTISYMVTEDKQVLQKIAYEDGRTSAVPLNVSLQGSQAAIITPRGANTLEIISFQDDNSLLKFDIGPDGQVLRKEQVFHHYTPDGDYVHTRVDHNGHSSSFKLVDTPEGWRNYLGKPEDLGQAYEDQWDRYRDYNNLMETWERDIQDISNNKEPVPRTGQVSSMTVADPKWKGWVENGGTVYRISIDLKGLLTRDGTDTASQLTAFGHGNDGVQGTQDIDMFYAGGGNDTLDGAAGDDVISGEDGNDSIQGGTGNDKLYGGNGHDSLYGGHGDDYIDDALEGTTDGVNVSGDDVMDGGEGDDVIHGRYGHDTLAGGHGDDYLTGDADNDWLEGNSGVDRLDGGDGNDQLDGGEGNDLLSGGDGDDVIIGGSGDDTLIGGLGADHLIGGDGRDHVFYGMATSFLYIDLSGDAGTGSEAEGDRLVGIEDVTGGRFGNSIRGSDAANALNGGLGADRLYGLTGHDTLVGYEGDDVLYGDAGNDVLYGDEGQDSLYGGEGEDRMNGGSGNDVLYGHDGNDTIDASYGSDTVDAGSGNDTVDGWYGNDVIHAGAGLDTVRGGEGSDTVSGGEGSDVLYGDAGHDVLYGDAGLDTLKGGDGGDTLYGGTDTDWLYGEAGDDVLVGEGGIDGLVGGDGSDRLNGGDGADFMQGDAGNDILSGGNDADLLYGLADHDTLWGDAGLDTLYGGTGDDWLYGGGDTDWLYGEAGNDALLGEGGIDGLVGGDGDDRLNGGDGADFMQGDNGNDLLSGGNDNDLLYGLADHDTLIGDAGNDTIIGGAGNDQLYGGSGFDQFVFNYGDGKDAVRDFGHGDVIRLVGVTQGTPWSHYDTYNRENKPVSVSYYDTVTRSEILATKITIADGREIYLLNISAQMLKGSVVNGSWEWHL